MNLFIISGVSHLYHVQNIIDKYNYTDNILIILELPNTGETEKNKLNLKKQIINKFFKKITFIKFSDLKDEYFGLVKENGAFSNLFMTAYTGVFHELAKHAKSNGTKLILFEEGLSTYKLAFIKNQSFLEKITSFFIKKDPVMQSQHTKPPGGDAKQSNSSTFRDLVRKYYYRFRSIIYKLKRKLEYRFFSGYDYAYVTYPEKLSKLMKVKKYEKNYGLDFPLNHVVEDTLEKVLKQIPEKCVLFMSQPMYHTGLSEEEFVEIVYKTLDGFTESNIVIKLHPRETDEKKRLYQEKIKGIDKLLTFIEGEDGLQIPSELLLRNNKIKKIVAFSSTTMIYTPLINKNIETVSIFNQIHKRTIEKNGPTFIMKEIKKELQKFNHIKFLEEQ